MADDLLAGLTADAQHRFWAKVGRAAPHDCWLWEGAARSDGHGLFRVGARLWSAHAVALALHEAENPGGRWALHSCDNPPCCNPDHLRWGSHQDNIDDMMSRGRYIARPGDQNPEAKLSEQSVRDIFAQKLHRKHGDKSTLARQYGVSDRTIYDIWNGRSWTHVTGLTCTRIRHNTP